MKTARMFPVLSLVFLVAACDGGGGGAAPDLVPDAPAGADLSTLDGGIDVAPDTGSLPADTTVPPGDTVAPPLDTTTPPAETVDPALDTLIPLDTVGETGMEILPDTPPEPAVPLPGFGEISGACGVLGVNELTDESPYLFVNHLDLGDDPYDDDELELLTPGGQEIWNDGNAGGSSIYSEIFAYEMLYRCELAVLLKTETEVEYTVPDSKITDLLVEIDGVRIGVSVTRAVGWPRDAEWTPAQAAVLLEKKLEGIIDSSSAVAPEDAWEKQILHIIAYADQHAASLEAALAGIDPGITQDTIVIVTVSDGDDGFLY
jgi:hypothetical protein